METTEDSKQLKWYALRATFGRAQKVYDHLFQHKEEYHLEPYLPLKTVEKKQKGADGKTIKINKKVPLLSNLLFVRCTEVDLLDLKKYTIPGFSLYYNHTLDNGCGGDPLMEIPEEQFNSFRTIVEKYNLDIITNQQLNFIEGEQVRVISGPFEGVVGKILKFRHQTRVFVQLPGIGSYGTAYVPKHMIEKYNGEPQNTTSDNEQEQ